MRAGPSVARGLFVAGMILVAAHVTLLVFDPRALFPSNLILLMYPLLGVTVCLLGAYRESPETRPLWLLFGCGLMIAAVGELGLTYYDFGTHIHTQTQALNSDFFFFAYGILTAILRIALLCPPPGDLLDQSHVSEQCGEFDSGRSGEPALLFPSKPGKKTLLPGPLLLSVGEWDRRSCRWLHRTAARLA
jgi:hypothetical protein